MGKKQRYIIIAVVLSLSLVSAYYVGTSITGRYVAAEGYDDFAKCLSESGAVMYGSKYCGHCSEQKEMFGDSFQHINYVECTEDSALCRDRGVSAVPAWEIDGELYVGKKSFDALAELTGCSLV